MSEVCIWMTINQRVLVGVYECEMVMSVYGSV